ncbi:alpha-L-rhamnosidase [Allonocardiopsis opalescens]|uniref:alpha-L-rhamnosidase n=1 Tax=Allonocardiopsis opalescens TaxID=1144618 RepID=A0A2T0Q1U8_9ACTN|nr:alpha-L-rhamnosidase [Allonocardiopsis opalescens]PRX97775.1 alpha-L-rhamnosidase [Allonocardiopsis opalescens]
MFEINRRTALGGMAGAAALSALAAGAARADTAGPLRPVGLTTEHRADPLGIDAAAPRFGWRLRAGGTGRAQRAYRITVASSRELLMADRPDVWDSGRVESAEQTARRYGGPALRSRTRYHWAVRVWDEAGAQGPVSEPAWFETALLGQDEWTADWIGTGADVPSAVRVVGPQQTERVPLPPGGTLGQSLVAHGPLATLAVLLGVPEGERGGCVMTLRADGPGGAELARTAVTDLVGDRYANAQGRLDLAEPVGPGTLYLELSEPQGELSWITADYGDPVDGEYPNDGYPEGTAFADGTADPGADRWVYGIPPAPPADPLLRHAFELPAAPVSARLYLAGLGHAVAWVNGERVGDAELSPPGTDFDLRSLYTTHDVTGLLRRGGNAVGIALGRGYYGTRAPDTDGTNLARWIAEPRARAMLAVTLDDGRRLTIGTGPDWQVTEGPTTYDGVFSGESYDARRAAELSGWSTPGHSAEGWRPAAVVPAPGGRLEADPTEPIRVLGAVEPVSVTRPADGVYLYDFGAVRAGWVRLRGRLAAGTTVRVQYHEKLGESGRIELGTPGGLENNAVDGRFLRDEYTASGSGTESWQPSWGYKSFRYVEVTGAPRRLDLVASTVANDLPATLGLEVDEPVLRWIADATERTLRNGLHGMPDAASSRFAWTTSTIHSGGPLLHQFAAASILGKWLDDIRLLQAPDGELPMIIPMGTMAGTARPTPSATSVYPFLVRRYWLTYGDPTVPERHYEPVRRCVEWMLARSDGGVFHDWFADWYPPQPPGSQFPNPFPPEGGDLVGTAYVIQALRDAAALAELVGEAGQAGAWRTRAEELTTGFNTMFLDTSAGIYRTGQGEGYRQTSNALPLFFGLVPRPHAAAVAANLIADVEERGHLDTGAAGTPALAFALTDNGRPDLAYRVFQRRAHPGYGFWRELGATTLWENWEEDARGRNDPTLSGILRWLVERVAGVEPLAPGWARFRVAPRPHGGPPSASAALDTVRGRVAVAWRRRGEEIALELTVPVNAVAELDLPGGERRELGSGRHRMTAPVR